MLKRLCFLSIKTCKCWVIHGVASESQTSSELIRFCFDLEIRKRVRKDFFHYNLETFVGRLLLPMRVLQTFNDQVLLMVFEYQFVSDCIFLDKLSSGKKLFKVFCLVWTRRFLISSNYWWYFWMNYGKLLFCEDLV